MFDVATGFDHISPTHCTPPVAIGTDSSHSSKGATAWWKNQCGDVTTSKHFLDLSRKKKNAYCTFQVQQYVARISSRTINKTQDANNSHNRTNLAPWEVMLWQSSTTTHEAFLDTPDIASVTSCSQTTLPGKHAVTGKQIQIHPSTTHKGTHLVRSHAVQSDCPKTAPQPGTHPRASPQQVMGWRLPKRDWLATKNIHEKRSAAWEYI